MKIAICRDSLKLSIGAIKKVTSSISSAQIAYSAIYGDK